MATLDRQENCNQEMNGQETNKHLMDQNASKLTVQDASAIMGVTPRFLQMALQQDKFPFGIGVKMGKWSYYINTRRFYEYMRMKKEG